MRTHREFTTALRRELQLRHFPFDLAKVLDLVASVWPIAEDDPELIRWADEFLAAIWVPGR